MNERKKRELLILGANERLNPGKVTVPVVLRYLKGEPIQEVELWPDAALRLAEQLIQAARHVIERDDL